MRVNGVGVALQVALQALLALGMAVGVAILLQRAGAVAVLSALLVLLTLFFFFALALVRALPARRQYRRRGPPRGTSRWPPQPPPGFGPLQPGDFGGVREPRRPIPPGMPPRTVAAEPDLVEPDPAEH